MIIGLSGGSGSGKSTVCLELEKYGCVIVDADKIYKDLTLPGKDLVLKIRELFGAECAPAPDYALDRRYLSSIVFSDKDKLIQLNELTHKEVVKEIHRRINDNKGKNIILDVPLLYESGLDKECDEIWAVVADLETRVNRLLVRDGISREEIEKRIASQISDEERIAKSNLVIYNDTISDTQEQIKTIAKERLN